MPGTFTKPSPGGAGERKLSPALFVLCAILLWGGALVLQLANHMLVSGPARLQKMQENALQRKLIPGRRGTIYDHNGRKLAWTELAFDLRWTIPENQERRQRELAEFSRISFLADRLPKPGEMMPGQEIVLGEDLTAAQATELASRGIRFAAVFQRHHDPAATGLKLGNVKQSKGIEIGISGLEQEYDYLLQANYGVIEVMLDKQGQWIPLSFQEIMETQAGQDIYLNYELP
jgi:cell division protein FtsI/penicillin-binding protein 2